MSDSLEEYRAKIAELAFYSDEELLEEVNRRLRDLRCMVLDLDRAALGKPPLFKQDE